MTADYAHNLNNPTSPESVFGVAPETQAQPQFQPEAVAPIAPEAPVAPAQEGATESDLEALLARARAQAAAEVHNASVPQAEAPNAEPELTPTPAPEVEMLEPEVDTPELTVLSGGEEPEEEPTPAPELRAVEPEDPTPEIVPLEESVDLDAQIAEVDRLEEERNEKAMEVVNAVRAEIRNIQQRKLDRAKEHKDILHQYRTANERDDDAIAKFAKIEKDILKRFGLKEEDVASQEKLAA